MIVIFHILTNFLYTLYKKHTSKNLWKDFTLTKQLDSPLAQRDAENDIKFDPPVYKQRYERATEILIDENWKNQIQKVVDFGCGELNFFVFLKNKIDIIREILFVDIDESLLRDCLYRVYPLNADYLIHRKGPLNVKVLTGSVTYPDDNLRDTDALIALELIEHLYPDTLDAFPYNIFGYICPKIVIITTPNSEFNVLFKNFKKFRHYDHKFEWTRDQFESWATNITSRFPCYTVRFEGIGLGPQGPESFGCCSQLAVFIRKDIICDNVEIVACVCPSSTCSSNICSCNCLPKCSYGVCTYNSCSRESFGDSFEDDAFKVIADIDYPFEVDPRNEEEKILDELKYRMNFFGSRNEKFYNEEKDRVEIPLKNLAYETSKSFPSVAEVSTILTKFNYQVEECLNQETNQKEACVIYEMDSGGSGNEASGYESDKYDTDNEQTSDWDDKDVSAWKESPPNTGVRTQLSLEVTTSKKQQEALFDSGYQKSPSVPDDSPQSQRDSLPLEYKSNEKPNRLSNILSVFDNFDKINELDACHREKKYFNFSSNLPAREVMKKICQEIAKHPIAGPSRDHKKSRNPNKSHSSDSEDSAEEIKSVATCILENSLNKIECTNEEVKGNLIGDLIGEEMPIVREEIPLEIPIIREDIAQEAVVVYEEFLQPVLLVENGDLANNNRDVEGNNYENFENPEPQNDNDVDVDVDNVDINIDNNNEIVEVPEEVIVEEQNVENEAEPPIEVAWSSREALFDVNSQVDLLEEFEPDGQENIEIFLPGRNSVANEAVLPPEESSFPNWLLQIFEEGEVGVPEDDLHDEPHFYCQGDGLGVHPSTVAINEDADDEGGDSTDSSSTSSSGSVDFANAENLQSEDLAVLGQAVNVADEEDEGLPENEEEEAFENAEGSESNLVSSCTQ